MPSPGAASHPGPFQETGQRHLLIPSLCLEGSVSYHTYSRLGRPDTPLLTSESPFSESCLPSLGVEPSVLFRRNPHNRMSDV